MSAERCCPGFHRSDCPWKDAVPPISRMDWRDVPVFAAIVFSVCVSLGLVLWALGLRP